MINAIKNLLAKETLHISKENRDWIHEALQRRPDTLDHFADLAVAFDKASKEPDVDLRAIFYNKANEQLEKLKVFFFKQNKILLAVPQRQRHPHYPAPNLGGFITPQNYRIKGEVCYNMPHAEARNWLVGKALEDPDISHILFVDDDIMLPLEALNVLMESHELIIGANYVKKQFPIETCALSVQNTPGGFHNKEILPIKNDMTPVRVSQMGMGACLINVEVFKKIPQPWFEFVYDKNGKVFAGEDVRFCQKAILEGIIPKIIPGLVPVHVDFKTGKHWGPDWLVQNDFLRQEYVNRYCFFQCDPKECFQQDIRI